MYIRHHKTAWLVCGIISSCCLVGGFVTQQSGRLATSRGKSRHGMSIDDEEKQRSEILDDMTRKIFGTRDIPTNPFAPDALTSSRKPRSGDLYDAEELQSVLQVHTQLTESRKLQAQDRNREEILTSTVTSSLHELVLETINKDDDVDSQIETVSSASSTNSWLDDKTRKTISNIRAIAADVDGTLLSSRHSLHPRTRQAILKATKASTKENLHYFFPATGKTRKGALLSLGPEIGSVLADKPGVFIQGLFCIDGDGNVVFEQKLEHAAIEACEKLVQQNRGVSVVAYDGDNLYSTEMTASVTELHDRYGEPMPQCIGALADHEPLMHKILVMDDDVERLTNDIRPKLEAVAKETGACVTQAIPTMLELIPEGCSKALGVTKLCKALGIDPAQELLAIGDAENDEKMLRMAAIGVAVGNACPIAKDAADFVMNETNDDGGAGCAMEIFGF